MDFPTWIEDAETKKLKNLPPPKKLGDEILKNLQLTVTSMRKIMLELEKIQGSYSS